MSQLNELLGALGEDAGLEREFRRNADVVMRRYALDGQERRALHRRDVDQLRMLSGPAPLSLGNTTVKSYA
jgi:hypothetical protein